MGLVKSQFARSMAVLGVSVLVVFAGVVPAQAQGTIDFFSGFATKSACLSHQAAMKSLGYSVDTCRYGMEDGVTKKYSWSYAAFKA